MEQRVGCIDKSLLPLKKISVNGSKLTFTFPCPLCCTVEGNSCNYLAFSDCEQGVFENSVVIIYGMCWCVPPLVFGSLLFPFSTFVAFQSDIQIQK